MQALRSCSRFRDSQSSPAGRCGSWWQPTPCSHAPVSHPGRRYASDPRRFPVPGVSPQRAIRTFWRPQPPKDPPYHRELKFGAECVGTYFSHRPPVPWGLRGQCGPHPPAHSLCLAPDHGCLGGDLRLADRRESDPSFKG